MKKYKKISAAIMAFLYFSCAVILTAMHHAGIVCPHDESEITKDGINHECVWDDDQCPICAVANLPKLSSPASVFVPPHNSCIEFVPKPLYTIFISRPDIRSNPYNAPPYCV